MAMMEDFKKNFVERTLEIIKNNYGNTEYEVTLLLNCLLALVSLPIEMKKNECGKKVDDFMADCVEKMKELSLECTADISYKTFFRNIRNAIAHLNIQVVSDCFHKNIEKIVLKSKNIHKKTEVLKIEIQVENLKVFAEYIAEEYLNRFFAN